MNPLLGSDTYDILSGSAKQFASCPVLLDLPVPLEPVCIDLLKPLSEQLSGAYLVAAMRFLANARS